MAKNPEQQQINLPSRELTTHQQLSSLLNVAGFCWSALQGPPKFALEGGSVPTEVPEKTEGWVAAENLFIKTCSAIEKIVDDAQRFDFSFQQKIEEDYKTAMQLNLEYIKANRDAAVEAASPHAVCNPALVRLQNGDYAAVLGNPASAADSLVGTGRSPREALEAFDIAFNGIITTQKNEQSKPVVTPTVEATPEPPKRRRIYPRSKPKSGPDTQGGGAGNVSA